MTFPTAAAMTTRRSSFSGRLGDSIGPPAAHVRLPCFEDQAEAVSRPGARRPAIGLAVADDVLPAIIVISEGLSSGIFAVSPNRAGGSEGGVIRGDGGLSRDGTSADAVRDARLRQEDGRGRSVHARGCTPAQGAT